MTGRQEQVAKLAMEGMTNIQIGKVLGISPETVKAHLRWVYEVTGVTRVTLWKLFEKKD